MQIYIMEMEFVIILIRKKICTIYEKRPLLCNLKESYSKYFSEIYTEEDFFELNLDACKKIKED
ncbi:MAG: hypothetical protein ACRC6E_14370 [Fusobacteriaceae bacterium]